MLKFKKNMVFLPLATFCVVRKNKKHHNNKIIRVNPIVFLSIENVIKWIPKRHKLVI